MSEFHVKVVQIGKVGKHPQADTLSITSVEGNYPVIFKTGAFQPGDLAVHIPPDAIVDTKIRNVPSYGFFVPLPQAGDDVRALYGVDKYDPGPCYQLGGDIAGEHARIPQEGVVPQYDIEALRKHESLLTPGEQIVITEKIHGSNGRWVVLDGELYCGSRTRFRQESVWNRMADKYDLKKILGGSNEGRVLYGEVYGQGIQDLTYGVTGQAVCFFDVYDSRMGRWWAWDIFAGFCDHWKIPAVPVLHRGPYDREQVYAMAEGPSVLAKQNETVTPIRPHMRKGIVVKPVTERYDPMIGRVFLKLVGEEYLLRKQAA